MLSVIIPAYNEEKRILNTIKVIEKVLLKEGEPFEIVAVNDGSTDTTLSVLQNAEISHLVVLSYKKNRGKGGAVAHGVLGAKGDVIVFTDADLPYPPENIIKAKKLIASGCDVVLGSRMQNENGQKYPWYRELMSEGFGFFVNLVLQLHEKDTQCGFKAFTKEAAQAIFKRALLTGWGFDVELIFIAKKHGFICKRLPVELFHSKEGSKIHLLKDPIRMMREVFKVKKTTKKACISKGEITWKLKVLFLI